jgi:predicted RNase H-like HicB family nuclease
MTTNVTITYHPDEDAWWADSSDLSGFTVVAQDLSSLRALAREAAEFYVDGPIEIAEEIETPRFAPAAQWHAVGAPSTFGVASGWTRPASSVLPAGVLEKVPA